MVEADGAQREGSSQQADVCEENSDGRLKVGQLLQDGRRFDELPVCQWLLHLKHTPSHSRKLYTNKQINKYKSASRDI